MQNYTFPGFGKYQFMQYKYNSSHPPEKSRAGHRNVPPCGAICHDGRLDRARDQEHGSHRKDGVQLGECGEDKRLTHHVVAVADCCDTVGTHLRLEIRRGEADQTRQQTGAKMAAPCNRVIESVRNPLMMK